MQILCKLTAVDVEQLVVFEQAIPYFAEAANSPLYTTVFI